MFFKKQKLYIGQFCRIFVQSCLNVPVEDISMADTDGLLDEIIKKKVESSIKNFRLLVAISGLSEKGQEGKIKKSSEVMGAIFVEAIKLACKDCGYAQNDTDELVKNFLKEMENFFSYLSTISEEEILQKSVRFFLCQWYSNQIFPVTDYKNEHECKINYLVFDIAKQVSLKINNAFDKLFKQTRFLD